MSVRISPARATRRKTTLAEFPLLTETLTPHKMFRRALLLDHDIGPSPAVRTSLRAVAANPVPMAAWGLTVAALLVLGSLPLFIGLAVTMPLLGNGTWHLYRKTVAW